MRKPLDRSPTPDTTNPLSAMTSPTDMVDASMALWRIMAVDVPLRLSTAVSGFVAHRLHAQAEQWTKLAACRNPQEILEAQAAFTRATLADYGVEAAAIAQELETVMPVGAPVTQPAQSATFANAA